MTAGGKIPPASSSAKDDGKIMPPLSFRLKLSMFVLCTKIFLDMVGYLVLIPTLIFYVRQFGGSDSQYGLILAANNFAAFIMLPVYGSWVDASGNKFRKPFMIGSCLCIIGMLAYTLAAVFPPAVAVHVLLASRIIYGTGAAAGSAMGVTYIATVVDPGQLTFCTQLFSVASYSGLAFGPFFNTLLSGLDTSIHLFGLTIPLNSYNGVGFLIGFFELIGLVLIYLFLPDPVNNIDKETSLQAETKLLLNEKVPEDRGWLAVFEALTSNVKLALPMIQRYVVSANYMLIETAFPPAVSHGLGWGPVQTSLAMGAQAIALIVMTAVTIVLSTRYKVPDSTMIVNGNIFWVISGIMMHSLWTFRAKAWHFVLPITIGVIGFPLIGPANTSSFSKATVTDPSLEPIRARLQSVFAMMGEIANFSIPLFVGNYVLRHPTVIESGDDPHELTSFALYTPIFSGICILGFLYEKFVLHFDDEDETDESEDEEGDYVSESTTLLRHKRMSSRHSLRSIRSMVSPKNESNRVMSSSFMGGNHSMPCVIGFDTASETKRHDMFLKESMCWDLMIQASCYEDEIETPAETPIESKAPPGNKKLVVLISSYSPNIQQKTNQDRAITIIKGLQIGQDQLEIIDGAIPVNKEKRNDLFALSGIRAKYPQFFLVEFSNQITFLADWNGFEAMNEMGSLKEFLNLTGGVEPAVESIARSSIEPTVESPTKDRVPTGNKKVVVLISSYSPNIQQKTNQDRALTILKGLRMGVDQLETIDGADTANKEKRNKLFALSGIRAKYPQFFLVDASDQTKFLADWDGFEAMNEMGSLKESINLQASGVLPSLEPTVASPPKKQAPTSNKKLVVLTSSFTSNIRQRLDQDRALTIIKGLQIGQNHLEMIDGAKPANKEKRNELFALSGIRAKYPQFFLVDANNQMIFFADWEGFESMNEMGSLNDSMNLS